MKKVVLLVLLLLTLLPGCAELREGGKLARFGVDTTLSVACYRSTVGTGSAALSCLVVDLPLLLDSVDVAEDVEREVKARALTKTPKGEKL